MLNFELLKNPVNWFVVGSMALVGIAFISLISAPLRAGTTAQA